MINYINYIAHVHTQKIPKFVGYLKRKEKVKERIVLSEIHLRTMGRHLSMGSHSELSATRQRWPPCLHPNRAGWYSIYWPRKNERLSWPSTARSVAFVWPHNLATRFRPPSTTLVSAELFSHGTGTLQCLQKEIATYRHWSVSLRRDPDDVSHCRILSRDKTEWRLISATLCGWRRCFMAYQLWLTTRIREEEEVAFAMWKLALTHTATYPTHEMQSGH